MQKLAFFRSREGLLHVWALVGGLYIRMKKMEMQLEFWIVGVGLRPLLHIWKVVYLLFTPENLGKPSQNTHTQKGERNDANQRFTWMRNTLPLDMFQWFWVKCYCMPPIEGGLSNPNLLSPMSSSSISFKADHLTYIKTKCLHSYSRRQLEALCTW